MKRTVIALIAGVVAAGAGAGQALTSPPPPPAAPSLQTIAQVAGSSQQANASATSTQINPQNTNVSVRVLSPGSNGPVSQSNSSAAAAIAANANSLAQSASQSGGGGYPGQPATPVQSAGQVASSSQSADAWANSTQVKPSNRNVSVRVLSPGDDGDVSQQNNSTAIGLALNRNETTQTATQEAGGGSPVQEAAQAAKSHQDAAGSAESTQIEPENTNVSVRVLSPGHGGSVSQQNNSTAIGVGANLNRTEQTATQSGGGYGLPIQNAAQVALSEQNACGCATSTQVYPKNTNVSVRTMSPGDDGEVSQQNNSLALGIAANKNHTDQTVWQEQDGYGDVAVQAAGQIASNDQDAWASADSVQIKPENANLSVRTLSPGHEDAVTQKNSSKALALSLNVNDLVQTADQSRNGGTGTYGAPHTKAPAPAPTIPKPGEDDDSVSQLNNSFAAAISANFNHTNQTATQSQHGGGGVAVQAAGQVASNEQTADSNAESFQYGARNESGRLTGPDPCKHDFCKPDWKPEKPDWKPDHCKPDLCKPKPQHCFDWTPDDCKRCKRKCEPRKWPFPCEPKRVAHWPQSEQG